MIHPHASAKLPAFLRWTPTGRVVVFMLSAASIWCLLAEMYGLCDMRTFFIAILLPATIALYGMAILDRIKGDGRLFRAVMIGTLGGLVAAVAYDLFRLPFVFSNAWGLGRLGIPQMPLFKVFPRFGALILGQSVEQGVAQGQAGFAWGKGYPLAAHVLGWMYHFSNGATFGVMFAACYSGAREACRAHKEKKWKPMAAGIAMAVGLEICLLISPYVSFFGLKTTPLFVMVTLSAHIVFGIALGLYYAWHSGHWKLLPEHWMSTPV